MKHARRDYQRIQDPLKKIPEDEPVFLLRAQDTLAAETVRFYAFLASSRGAQPLLIKNSMAQADAMEKWHIKKSPDMPEVYHGLEEKADYAIMSARELQTLEFLLNDIRSDVQISPIYEGRIKEALNMLAGKHDRPDPTGRAI